MSNNFIVSARKYRPATFVSVVGQSHITSTLKNAIARNQLAHAYLFCGPRGVGKTTCARIFAKTINCSSPVDGEACGMCESCSSFNEGRSFNIHELDAASNNSIEDIRNLTEQVRIPPQVGHYSVYIIDEVHMLSASAFNAFLKTLEEPPTHAVFILATTEKHKIIPTILSRCQIYDFNRIRVEDSVGYLRHIASQESVSADDESLNLISQKADGGMRDALSMFDKAVAFCGNTLNFREVARTLNILDYETYFTVTDLAGAGDYKGALLLFDEVLRKGFSGQTFISGLNNHLRDLLMCKDPNTLPLLEVTGSLLERYKQQSAKYDPEFLFGAISLISAVDSGFKTTTNQRLHVELGLMKLCAPAQKKTPLTNETFPLPDLQKGDGKADTQKREVQNAVAQNATASASVVPDTPSAAASAAASTTPVADPATVRPTATTTAATTSSLSPTAESAPAAERPQNNTVQNAKGLSGVSITDILNGKTTRNGANDTAAAVTEVRIDPETERKVAAVRENFIRELSRQRPRIATALQTMSVSGNIVSAEVTTDLLREDILLHQKDILGLLISMAGIDGDLRFDITVSENTAAIRPIRPEDKLAYLQQKNPLIDVLRRELSLEME